MFLETAQSDEEEVDYTDATFIKHRSPDMVRYSMH